jgi:plasmid maintenance system antidote protein VapI
MPAKTMPYGEVRARVLADPEVHQYYDEMEPKYQQLCQGMRDNMKQKVKGTIEVLRPARPIAPARIIRREMGTRGWALADAAKACGVMSSWLWQVLEEDAPISERMAAALGRGFGMGKEMWLNLEREYRAIKG